MNAKKVLIVDDGVDFITAYKAVLEADGQEVIFAVTGKEGMRMVDDEKPDVVILDVMMESADSGFEFLNELNAKGNATPVILCSSIINASLRSFDLNALGAKVVMQKPVNLEKLVMNVRKYAK